MLNNMYPRDSEYKAYNWLQCAVSSDHVCPGDGRCYCFQRCPCMRTSLEVCTCFSFPSRLPSFFPPLMHGGGVSNTHSLYIMETVLCCAQAAIFSNSYVIV